MPIAPILSKIKPEYSNLVKYSKSEEPLQEVPDCQPFNASKIVAENPVRRVSKQQDADWAQETRKAAA